jgi:hypothetical protein
MKQRSASAFDHQRLDHQRSDHHGKFVTIDLQTQTAWIDEKLERAIALSVENNPEGKFHLTQVGETLPSA